MIPRRTLAALVALPFVLVGLLVGAADMGARLAPTTPPPSLTCPEAARIMNVASRSNGVHWHNVSCTSVKTVGPHDWEAKLSIDDGGGTIHEWTTQVSLDQFIITGAVQTGTHTIPKG